MTCLEMDTDVCEHVRSRRRLGLLMLALHRSDLVVWIEERVINSVRGFQIQCGKDARRSWTHAEAQTAGTWDNNFRAAGVEAKFLVVQRHPCSENLKPGDQLSSITEYVPSAAYKKQATPSASARASPSRTSKVPIPLPSYSGSTARQSKSAVTVKIICKLGVDRPRCGKSGRTVMRLLRHALACAFLHSFTKLQL